MGVINIPEHVSRQARATYDIPSQDLAPTLGQTFGAGFRLENDVYNLIDFMSRPTFAPDPEFDPVAYAKDRQLFLRYPESFGGVQSAAEFDAIEQRLLKEEKDRAILASSGMVGIAAGIAAGTLSPTILIPLGGVARAPSVAAGAVRGAAWTAGGAAIQEGVLQINQDLRTGGETAIGLTTATVMGGLLGGAIRYLDPLKMDRMVSDMVDGKNTSTILPLHGESSVGAKATPAGTARFDFEEAGRLEGAFGLTTVLNRLGPVTRMAQKGFQTMRWAGAQLSTGGVHREFNVQGVPTARGGDVESLIKGWYAGFAEANDEVKRLFREHVVNAKKGSAFRARFGMHAEFKHFSEEIGKALEIAPALCEDLGSRFPCLIMIADHHIELFIQRGEFTLEDL